MIAKEIYTKLFGSKHPSLAGVFIAFAMLMRDLKNFDKALILYNDALEIRRSTYGEEHINSILVYTTIAGLYLEMGDFDKSKKLFEKYLPKKEKLLGKEHPGVIQSHEKYSKLLKMINER